MTAIFLHRAISEGLAARRDKNDPHVAWISSSSKPAHWYRVTRTSCTCIAFSFNGTCKHQALAIHLCETGRLPWDRAGEVVRVSRPSLIQQVRSGWQLTGQPSAVS